MFSLFVQKVYAQGGNFGGSSGSNFDSILTNIATNIVEPINMFLAAAALMYFLWGVFNFIKGADNSGKREEGIQHIMWGLFGLVLTISVEGFISVIKNTLGV
ncbi:MAG: hypothetical protein WC827_01955 [Candidatus Paceibacterota bacterium]|jgi:hypothetical protein